MTKITEELARALVRAHTPRGYSVRFTVGDGKFSHDRKMFVVHDPVVNPELCVAYLFHELGHYHLRHHKSDVPKHREEYEAEMFAFGAMRGHGIPVSRRVRDEARRNVRLAINCDVALGVDVDDKIRRWAGPRRRDDDA